MITPGLRQMWRTLVSKGEPNGHGVSKGARGEGLVGGVAAAGEAGQGLVGGVAAAEEAAEGFQAGGRVVRCRPLVEGAPG
jgi:hypothetical protein